MKSKKISVLLAGIMTATMVLNPYVSTVKNVSATTIATDNTANTTDSSNKNSIDIESDSTENAAKNSVYLSSLNYETNSFTNHGNIVKNANTNGSKIRLKIDGEVVTFDKGMGAHATSEIIYNISEYSNEYTRLSTYLGVDYSQAGKGNGVKFKIYTSNDASNWKLIKETEVLTAAGNSLYVDLNVANVKYIKLQADMNGSNANDHSVYGDLRLIKTGYDINSELYQGFQPLTYYDDILSKKTVEDNYKNNLNLVLKREFVNRIGYRTIQNAVKDNKDVKEALEWLINDEDALQLFIEAGTFLNGSGSDALNALSNLYKNYKGCLSDSENGYVYKKMLIATAVAYSKTIRTYVVDYGGSFVQSDPVKKFKAMKELYDEGKFVRKEEFKTYNMELVRYVMDAKMDDEEIKWLRYYSEDRFPNDISKRVNGYSFVKYIQPSYGDPELYSAENREKWDKKYKLTQYGVTSYGEKNRFKLWMVMEKGGICWGISGVGANLNEVHGIPAVNVYQPGHEAYLVYTQNEKGNGLWNIWNNVGNWSNSYTRWGNNTNSEARMLLGWGCKSYNKFNKNNASYIVLAQGALNKYENYKKSLFYNLIANSYKNGSAEREEAYNKALQALNINLDSYDGLIDSYKASGNKTSQQWTDLAKRIIKAYTYYPLPMVEALDRIIPNITDKVNLVEINTLKTNALNSAKDATGMQSLQPDVCKIVANSLLGKNTVALASFSFSGKYANQIRLNEDYENVNLMVKYSLDGGITWKQSENHTIQLTEEEVNSITAENDIKVGLVGSDTIYTIDIQNGKDASNLYRNDLENLLIGADNNLQYSEDNGVTWKDYVSGLNSETRFTGNKVVKVRYKAYDNYLQGLESEYTFYEDKNTAEQSYLQLRHVKLYEYSSQNNNQANAAINLIDGHQNTNWHTLYNGSDKDKFYSVEFDKVRFISKLTYLPSMSANGRLKSGDIYTSMDGNTWEKVHSFTDIANSNTLQSIILPSSVQAKYLKIVATETWGNSASENNKFFGGRMLNFYEDTTKTYIAEPIIEYSTETTTNENVIATLKLPTNFTAEETEFTFTENGSHIFTYADSNGVQHTLEAKVHWIDKEAPDVQVQYDVTESTNGNVTATLVGLAEDEEVVNNHKSPIYTFSENGSFEFIVRDKAGNEAKVVAEVNWIIKEKPAPKVTYSTLESTKENVTVSISEFLEEGSTIKNNDGKDTYTFTENGTFEFIVVDKYGNETIVPVEVNCIDKTPPMVVLNYSTINNTNEAVTVTIDGLQDDEVVVNNDGNPSYTFTENGAFEFIVRDKAGNETKSIAVVDWIKKTGNDGEYTNEVYSESTVEYATNEVTIASSTNNSENISDNNAASNTSESNKENKTDSKTENKTDNKKEKDETENSTSDSKEEEDLSNNSISESFSAKPTTIAIISVALASIATAIFVVIKKFFR